MPEPETQDAFAVVDWDATFEVDDKGGPWKAGKPFRSGPLNYLRLPTVGTFARRWAMIDRVVGEDGLWVRGVFDEVLRLVSGMNRPGREGGVIRGVDGQPASVEGMAECLGLPIEKVSRAVSVLADRRVGLLQEVTHDEHPAPSEAQEAETVPGKSPEILGIPRSLSSDSDTEAGAAQSKAEQSRAEQEQGQEQRPGDQDGSARTALSSFDSLLTALRTAYGDNRTIGNFAGWLLQRYERSSSSKWAEVQALVKRLIEKSRTADGEPAAFFIGAVEKSPEDGGFGYVPASKRRG